MSAWRCVVLPVLFLGFWTVSLPAAAPNSAVHAARVPAAVHAGGAGQEDAAVRGDDGLGAIALGTASNTGEAVDLSSAPKRAEYETGTQEVWGEAWMNEPILIFLFGSCLITAALVPAWWAARRKTRV